MYSYPIYKYKYDNYFRISYSHSIYKLDIIFFNILQALRDTLITRNWTGS